MKKLERFGMNNLENIENLLDLNEIAGLIEAELFIAILEKLRYYRIDIQVLYEN